MATWIDFKELRENLDFEKVLEDYGVELKKKGQQHHGFCPLPTHQGKRRSASFSVNLNKGIFQCFGCGAKGNVIEFACRMEGLNPESGSDFRKAALKLQHRFLQAPSEARETKAQARSSRPKKSKDEDEGNVVVNAPLDFSLKRLDPSHPYLFERGLTEETIAHFGLGYANRGMLKERIAIPIHDPEGQLVGYAGRVVEDSAIGEEVPKYKFPSQRERDGTTYVFRKSSLVYNLHRLERPLNHLIVVEGFPSVWWLHQAGLANTVAIMGSSMSDRQRELIVDAVVPHGAIWVLPDGDEAGQRWAQAVIPVLATERFVRWAQLEKGKQPTDCSAEEIHQLVPASDTGE